MAPRLNSLFSAEQLKEVDEQLRDTRHSYAAVARWMAMRGWHATAGQVRSYALHGRIRPRRASTTMKIDTMLSPEDLKAYEELLSDRRTTRGVALEWLKARGYEVGGQAVGTYRRRFLEKLDSVRDSARMAGAIITIAREQGSAAVLADGMLSKCEQVLMEQFTRLPERGDIDARTLSELCKAVGGAMQARETFEAIRRGFEQDKHKAADAAESAARGGASAKEVAERVREILGV